jgi:hypothetical protein
MELPGRCGDWLDTDTVTVQGFTLRLDTTSKGWGLLLGHQRGLTNGHLRGLSHGHGQLLPSSAGACLDPVEGRPTGWHEESWGDQASSRRHVALQSSKPWSTRMTDDGATWYGASSTHGRRCQRCTGGRFRFVKPLANVTHRRARTAPTEARRVLPRDATMDTLRTVLSA